MYTKVSEKPLVSVIMGIRYLRKDIALLKRSVGSVRAQTMGDFELLICDDGSTEQASAYLDGLAKLDSRLRLIRPGDRFDLASKLNACIACAQGEFLARMDDDDWAAPNRFQLQLDALKDRPDIAFVGSNATLRCDGAIVGEQIYPQFPQIQDFYMVQPFLHPALIFRYEVMEAVKGYSENPHQVLCEDYDLLLRIYAKGMRGMNLQTPLLDYSISANPRGSRTLRHRWNESVTRWCRFNEMGLLPRAFPYVVKPLATGLLPKGLLKRVKFRYYGNGSGKRGRKRTEKRDTFVRKGNDC